jgi:hypothetical protein
MSETEVERFQLSDPQDAEVTQYQAISGLAVVGLIVGILSLLALAHPFLWIVPAAGIVLSATALWRIIRDPAALVGRKPALAGLVLSVLFGAMAPADWFTYWYLVDREGRQFAAQWFEFLRRGEVIQSVQLMEPAQSRLALNDRLWKHYPRGSQNYESLESYVTRPEIRSLLALGPTADVRYYDTQDRSFSDGADHLEQVWAVTTEKAGQRTSYFIRLNLKRYPIPSTGRAFWQLLGFKGGIRPDALGGERESGNG